MSRYWLAAVALVLPALSLSGQLPRPVIIGTWTGDGQIVVNWTDQPSIHVWLVILGDGSVSGDVGDAQLANGRISRNRGAIGRFLHVKTDYIVSGELHGPVIASEHIHREAVKMPLNWDGNVFNGSLHTSGSAFGGADRMVLTAFHLRLTREPPASERLSTVASDLNSVRNLHTRTAAFCRQTRDTRQTNLRSRGLERPRSDPVFPAL